MPVTIPKLLQMKKENQKISALTAYDFPFARILDESGVHIILVGDSVGNVIQGKQNSLPVTMDEMIYHTKMVSRAVENAMVIGDMPFMSYQTGIETAIANAGRFLKETGASAVKLEGGAAVSHVIKAVTRAAIPVQAHIGLTPQYIHQLGGHKVQRDEDRLIADAKEVETAGAFSVVLESIPADIAKKISDTISIPTIGIGAGPHCNGQILVLHDMIGLYHGHMAKFVKQYINLREVAKTGIADYIKEVQEGTFPGPEHSYS